LKVGLNRRKGHRFAQPVRAGEKGGAKGAGEWFSFLSLAQSQKREGRGSLVKKAGRYNPIRREEAFASRLGNT